MQISLINCLRENVVGMMFSFLLECKLEGLGVGRIVSYIKTKNVWR
jgi:hypothetical protein